MDAGMDGVDDVEQADSIYSQICDEIGVDLGEEAVVGKKKLPEANQQAVVSVIRGYNFSVG